ncbi:ankyrin repeat domain-containing protein [Erythrobacter jejuensis]|uniref:Ankyrin repeat domain-containing protein n=2 Tax=Parerythrobacter jejuensis TaxID=795812 RepID=A0A845ATC4_9SPHN|nr:ankyrin repeat domain-containing protein [Parerythrobacter jejuensis]MXP34132.1 ankyrin repeat domain-containing protein [Parerythrobacter jejuensis]
MFSEGYSFLEAVKDRDAEKVTTAVDTPGSTLINTRDIASGRTALHIVAERRDATWIRFLTQKGANPNVVDKKGISPLMISSNLGHLDGVEAFLDAGARVDDTNSLGETPLISATHRRDFEMIRLLLANGANPDRSDNSGRTARDYAEIIGSRRLMDEFTAADEARKGKETKSYGPSF